ncbi:hypothetical protein ACU686_00980 [Yinghuangia aomiensis]
MAGLGQRHGPMAVLVDDAHWADRESLAWLESYARTSDAAPVLIIVTRRPEEPTPNADLLDDLRGPPARRGGWTCRRCRRTRWPRWYATGWGRARTTRSAGPATR